MNPIYLKPCPFCGEKAKLFKIKRADGSLVYEVDCENENCEVGSCTALHDTAAAAADIWNNRIIELPLKDVRFRGILIAAIRYAIGRKSALPSTITSWIMEKCEELPDETIDIILHDIQEQREAGENGNWDSLGDPCDVDTWNEFENWLKEKRGADS